MPSPVVIVTAVESSLGALLTSAILYLVLSRGRRTYHYLFAAFLLICLIWDLGTFLLMIRNAHTKELEVIGYIIAMPCGFIPALIFHFSCEYTGRQIKWAIALGWTLTGALWILGLAGIYWRIEGVYAYGWGNVFRVAPSVIDPLGTVVWFGFNLSACWLLYRAATRATSRLERRHRLYIAAGLLVITLAILKVGVVIGIDVPALLPLGMFFVDVFNAIIGVAIIKDRLFDITPIINKGALYSILAGLLVFIFSFTEHLLITYFGKMIAGRSAIVDLFSIAVGIAILMPVKQRLERVIDGYFAQKRLEF